MKNNEKETHLISEEVENPSVVGEQRLIRDRLDKLTELKGRGIDPYPAKFDRTHSANSVINMLQISESENDDEMPKDTVRLAGRIHAQRRMGKVCFIDIKDASGKIQLFMRKDNLGESYGLLDFLDMGDFIGVEGQATRTRTGEPSVSVTSLSILTKSLRPLPDKWAGLQDVESRFRQRYLDLLSSEKTKSNVVLRSNVVSNVRSFMMDLDFIEVETPILVPVAGGASARPFSTHHNQLNRDLYLRIGIPVICSSSSSGKYIHDS